MALFRKSCNGYVGIADGRRTKLFHVVIAELALRKPLPKGAVVHHVDGNPQNNWPANLVVCQDQAYHKLLHQRSDALNASGHADWLKCKFCGQYDAPQNLRIYSTKQQGRNTDCRNIHHQACNAKYLRDRYAKRKGEVK